jgi:hypothetical protein
MTDNSESRSRWRWITLGALILLIVSLVSFLDRRTLEDISTSEHVNTPSRVIEPSSSISDNELPKSHSSSSSSNNVDKTNAAAVTYELCGVSGAGRVRIDGETLEQHVTRITNKAIGRWKAALLASKDSRRHAVALALDNANPQPNPLNYSAPDTSSNNNLVLLAMETNDPAIYALALGQCGEEFMDMAAGPCQGLSVEHWAQIDPDNAVPWLWVASRADKIGSHERANEALGRALNASRFQSYVGMLGALALNELPPDVTPLEKTIAGDDVISIARLGTPLVIVNLCAESALQIPERKEQCSLITNMLASQGSTIIEVAMAAILSKRLGWPDEKSNSLSAESDSYRLASRDFLIAKGPDANQEFRCEKVLRNNSFVDQIKAHKGNERAAIRATIEASNKQNSAGGTGQ